MNQDLIPLQASHVTQHTNGHIKSDWSVELNITDEQILVLPKHYTDAEVFHIMDFAKKYELEAMNIGIRFAKKQGNEYMKSIIDEQKKLIVALGADNERLAAALETEFMKHVIEE